MLLDHICADSLECRARIANDFKVDLGENLRNQEVLLRGENYPYEKTESSMKRFLTAEDGKTRHTRRSSIVPAFAVLAILLPLSWVPGRTFSFADYPLTLGPLAVGITCVAGGLGLLYRAHADLGTNWSSTVQIREHQRLITHGIYRRVRHPMYSAYLLYGLGQALLIPNWVVGPSTLVMLGILISFRIPDEERMMLATFGEEDATYMGTTQSIGSWRPVMSAPNPRLQRTALRAAAEPPGRWAAAR